MTFFLNVLISFFCMSSPAAEFPEFSFEESRQVPIVYFELVFDGGVVQDPPNQQGLTQLSSQLFLKGTKDKTSKAFHSALNQLGGHLEVDVKSEGVLLEGVVLAEHVPEFLNLIEELLMHPRLDLKDFQQLQKEIQSAILERKTNDRVNAQIHFEKAFFGDHPYGHPEHGTIKGLNRISFADAKQRAQAIFNPKRMRLFGSGDADQNQIKMWFNRVSTQSTNASSIPLKPIAAPEAQQGKRIILIDKPNATQSQILLGGRSLRPEDPGFYPILLSNHAFGGGNFQSRLMQELRVKRGWTYGAFNQFQNGKHRKYFQLYVFPKTHDTLPSIQLMIELLNQWKQSGISKEEFAFSQKSLIKNAPFQFDTAKKRLQNLTLEYLKNYPVGFYRNIAENMQAVRFESVQPSLSQYLNVDDLTLVVLGDAKKLRNALKALPGFQLISEKNYLDE